MKTKGYDAYFVDCPNCMGSDPGCIRCLGVGKIYWAQKVTLRDRVSEWWFEQGYRQQLAWTGLGWFLGVLTLAGLLVWWLSGWSF